MRRVLFDTPRKNRVAASYEVDGTIQWIETVSPQKGDQVRKLAGMLGMDARDLLRELLQPMPHELGLPDAEKPRLSLKVRNIGSPDATPVADFDAALATPGEIICWDDPEQLCCLDVDYHKSTPPHPTWLLATVQRMKPLPWLYWLSKGGGLHLMYRSIEHLAANELAAAAAISYLSFDRNATVELLKSTRKPPGEIYVGLATSDLSALGRFFGTEMETERLDDYLDGMGWSRGNAYPHERCPIAPGPSHGEPVHVGDSGVFCHRCAGMGVVYGSRTPGFFPYTHLCGGGVSDTLRTMCRRFCHWEHARVFLEHKLGLRGAIARLAWKGFLHLSHGDDVRVHRAMTAGQDLIRMDGRWATANAYAPYNRDITAMIAELPACQTPEGAPNAASVCRYMQAVDLTEFGYPAISNVAGCRIYSQKLTLPDSRVVVVTPSAILKSGDMESRRPKYDPSMPLEDAWAVYEKVFPGINRNYLLLLIAAKGISEAQLGPMPNIIVDGVSSSGKSQTMAIAAATCGDDYHRVGWTKDTQRFVQALHTAAHAGTFIGVDELMKDSTRPGSTALQAMDIFLNLTPESLAHKLHVGAIPLGKLPVVVVTDISIPPEIRQDFQISRRFTYVHLEPNHVDWKKTVHDTIGDIKRLRVGDEIYVAAANRILSHVIDEFFSVTMTFDDIAFKLGFDKLAEAKGFDDPIELLRKFYFVCEMASASTDRRWAGDWKVLRRHDETELAEIWQLVCDGDGPAWYTSRKVAERDWQVIVGKSVRCEVKRQGESLGVRFVNA